MSRRGKDQSFHPHPGDPWHPGWIPEDVEAAAPEEEARADAAESPAPTPPPSVPDDRPAPPPFAPPAPSPAAPAASSEGPPALPRDPVPPPWAPGEEATTAQAPPPAVAPWEPAPELPPLPPWLLGTVPPPRAESQPGPEVRAVAAAEEPPPSRQTAEEPVPPVRTPAAEEPQPAAGGPVPAAMEEPEAEQPEAEPVLPERDEVAPPVFEPAQPAWPPPAREPQAEPPAAPPAGPSEGTLPLFAVEPERLETKPRVLEPEAVEPPVVEPEAVEPPAVEPEAEAVEPALTDLETMEAVFAPAPAPPFGLPEESAGPVPPPWEPGEPVAGEPAPEDELEVAEWLTFTEGTVEPAAAEEVVVAAPPPRRRWWPFGRRSRAVPEAGSDEAAEASAEAPAAAAPQPPPWAPGEEAVVPPALPEELEAAAAAPYEGMGPEDEGIEPAAPDEDGDSEAAWEEWAAGEEMTDQVPVAQSDLDRPAAIPVIGPSGLGEQPAEPGEAGPGAGWDEGEVEPEAGEAAWPRAWGEPPGSPSAEPSGEESVEMEPSAPPWGPISEEMFVGAVTTEHRDLAEEVAAADSAQAQLQALSAPMAGLESGVVGFEDVVEPGQEVEVLPAPRSDLPLRVVTGMVLVAILLGSLWVGGEVLAGFVGLLAILGLAEFYGALRRVGHQPLALFGYLAGAGLLAAVWFHGLVVIPIAAIGLTVVCFFYYSLASRRRDPLTNGGLTVLGVLWVPATVAFAFPIAAAPDFRVLVLAVAIAVIANDVGAFFAGRSWGSRALAPVVSPNKTVEGLAGGVVLAVAAAVAMGYFFDPLNIRIGAGLGLVVAFLAPVGDLAESMVKRSLGLKDMGSILPGHGGILDRIDAYLFVLPGAWVLFEALGLLR